MKILYSSENGDYKCNEKNILLEILIVMTNENNDFLRKWSW